MAKEICISSTPHETRLAILEDDQLAEIYYERENEYTLAGSIYNGRVTRVLPGMQSAFVDIGLERDAFLYVTDFIDLEDQEETDELEKAATSGAPHPPYEVRHISGQERNGSRNEERGARAGERQQTRQSTAVRERGLAPEIHPEVLEDTLKAPDTLATSAPSSNESGDAETKGGRRWRGRRHRRGARGPQIPPEAEVDSTESGEAFSETLMEHEVAADIYAAEARVPATTSRTPQTPVSFVLPGESLSKYGGAPTDGTAKPSQQTPERARPVSYSKPSTLVETPITWDGSGLLPGESLSRHRARQSEPAIPMNAGSEQELPVEVQPLIESEKTAPDAGELPAASPDEAAAAARLEASVEFEESFDLLPERDFSDPQETIPGEAASERVPDAASEPVSALEEATRPESDSSATHRVDPISPAGFRLFGLSGKKKKKEEEPASAPSNPPAQASVSTYAPGTGPIEEEVIEGEELEAPPRHRHHKLEERELDNYEEETFPAQVRTGDFGDLLQEAQFGHRIQLNLTERGGEEEGGFEGEVEEEEAASSEAQHAPGRVAEGAHGRGGRGRRGRGGQAPGNRRGPSRRSMQTTDLPVISDLLKPGQEILVQIAKEPIAKKGARITSHIALPGRFLVFMPTVGHVGVSRKIASDEERQRLKRILMSERGETSGGFIVRTAADGASEEELRADLRFLMNLWNDIKQRSDSSKSPALIYHDLSLIERILRDQVSSNFSNIWVDSEADYERVVRFLNRFSPSLVRRVKLYTKETPLFEHFGVQDEISKALRSKVWLKSGGSIVINQTEALVAIDINTGKYVGKSARLEDTILKTNLDAVPEIVRQIRLRDLGGIIVIDFIDMDERKNRFRVMAALEEALKSDRAPTKVLQFNDFGLVAITRKRVKQSLERTLSVPCPICQATGMVKSPTTVCNEIWVELRKMRKHFDGADVTLRVNPETVKVLKANNANWLSEFEELIGKNILVKSDPTLHPEQFDIQG